MVIKRTFYIFLFIGFYVSNICQTVKVKFGGVVFGETGNLSGVSIKIEQENMPYETTITDDVGRYSFFLPLGGDFLVTVSKEGFVSKKFTANTSGVPIEKASSKFPDIEASLSLFKHYDGVDYSLLNEPINKYRYNPSKDNFEYDEVYLKLMLEKMKIIKEEEKIAKNKEKNQEVDYQNIIKAGDIAFTKNEWQVAIANYERALAIKPADNYPKEQIVNIKKIIAEIDAKAKANAETKSKIDAETKAKAEKELEEKLIKAEKEFEAKLIRDKAIADAKIKAEAEADSKKAILELAIKAKAEKELAVKLANDKAIADAKAKAEIEAKAKKEAEEAAAIAKAEKEFEEKLVKENAAKEAKLKADAALKAEKELAEKLANDKLILATKIKAESEAIAKKVSDDTLTLYNIKKELADNLAKEKALAEAKMKADYEAAAKKAEIEFAIANAKAEKALEAKLAKEKLEAIAKQKDEKELAAKLEKEKIAEEKAQKIANESKYKSAIKSADSFFKNKEYVNAKKYYEMALNYKGGNLYAKDKLLDCEKIINADENQHVSRIKKLLSKYSPGVTEETIEGNGVIIIQRVVVKSQMAWVYEKKMFSWGGTSFFRDANPITESTFESETKP